MKCESRFRLSWLLGSLAFFLAHNCFAEAPFSVKSLSTGLELVTYESHKVPLVTIVLCSKAGAMTEEPHTDGLTHVWEHMFFKGNKKIPNQEAFNRRIQELGIVYNGDTSAEKVRYYFTLPSSHLAEGLDFMLQAIKGPLLDPVEMKKELKVVVDEYDRNASSPGFDLRRLKKRIIYGDKFYLRSPLGERDIILSTTRDILFKIKDEVFVPHNSALLISGDFDPKTIEKLVASKFKDWRSPKGWLPKKPPAFPPFPKTQEVVMVRENTRNVSISSTFLGPKARHQPKPTYAADILIQLLNLKTGRFHRKYVDSGRAFSAGLGYYTQSQSGEVVIYGYAKAENAKALKEDLLKEPISWLQKDYFTEEQLEDVKRGLKVGRMLSLNKPSEYVKDLAFWWAVTGLDYYETYLPELLNISLEDVRVFIKEYLIKKDHVTTIFLNSKDAKVMGVKDNAHDLMKKYF